MTAPTHPVGQPLPIFTPAFEAIIRVRLEQQAKHGHTLAADMQAGVHQLVGMAYGANLKAAQRLTGDAAKDQQAVLDQTMGHVANLTEQDLRVAYSRLAKSAALIIAAMDVLDTVMAQRQQQENHHGQQG